MPEYKLLTTLFTTNLLTPQEQQAIRYEEWLRIVRFFAAGLTGVLVIGIILIMPSYIPLMFEQRSLERSVLFEEESSEKLKIDELFAEARAAENLTKDVRFFIERPSKTLMLLDVFFTGAQGIFIESFSLPRERDLSLNGFAKTRRDLIDFELKLKESGLLDDISFPISDIVQGTDIQFTMKGKLKQQYRLGE